MFKIYSFLFSFLRTLFLLVGKLGNSKINNRLDFENKNKQDLNSRSFIEDNLVADVTIEISSEGELEQIMPLIRNYVERDKLIEIIYSSESVEDKIKNVHSEYPNKLRSLRFEILRKSQTHNFIKSWMTSKKLIMVRYDFYPDLLEVAVDKDIESTLVWATFTQHYRSLNVVKKFILKNIYSKFDKFVFATKKDELFFNKLNIQGKRSKQFDFRPANIQFRIEKKDETLEQKNAALLKLKSFLENTNYENRVMLGSLWASDLGNETNIIDYSKYLICICPHKISSVEKENLIQQINKSWKKPKLYMINQESIEDDINNLIESFSADPGIIYINLKGILVELYPLFKRVYVGGGFEVSVHSLLEPFMAGANIICGPQVHRSSEFDLIYENAPDSIKVIHNNDDILSKSINLELYPNDLKNFDTKRCKEVIEWI